MAKIHRNAYLACFHCPGCGHAHCVRVEGGLCYEGEHTWGYNGNEDAPTFTPSLLVNRDRANPGVPVCHSFITDGRIQFLGDCTHALAGQTVEIPEWNGWGQDGDHS